MTPLINLKLLQIKVNLLTFLNYYEQNLILSLNLLYSVNPAPEIEVSCRGVGVAAEISMIFYNQWQWSIFLTKSKSKFTIAEAFSTYSCRINT